jgi:hypothetical protein
MPPIAALPLKKLILKRKTRRPTMKKMAIPIVAVAFVALATTVRADDTDRDHRGYTNADIKGGYGCGVSGTLGGAPAVGTAQYHPQGDGTFSESVFTAQLNGVGICNYSLVKGTGLYNINPNGVGLAQFQYSLQEGSASSCPSTFPAT